MDPNEIKAGPAPSADSSVDSDQPKAINRYVHWLVDNREWPDHPRTYFNSGVMALLGRCDCSSRLFCCDVSSIDF